MPRMAEAAFNLVMLRYLWRTNPRYQMKLAKDADRDVNLPP